MEYGKPLSLVGLGASATTAATSPVYGFNDTTPDPGLIPFASTLFPGLKNDSPNLYPTFNLHCTKKIFRELDTPDPIKSQVIESEDPTNFEVPSHQGVSFGDGCLRVDFKYFKDSSTGKGNLVATIEMAAEYGGHGIIVMNSISNMLNRGGAGFDYRALFLEKKNGKPEIKAGVQWQDKLFMDGSKPEKMKWTLPNNEVIDEIFWKSSICKLSQDCEAQLKSGKTEIKKNYTYEWCSPRSSGHYIYQGLKIENLSASPGSTTSDFWNGQETPLSGSNVIQKPSAIYVNGQWRKTTGTLATDMTKLQRWFNIFKSDKGFWQR